MNLNKTKKDEIQNIDATFLSDTKKEIIQLTL
jgi:hypothetical protein